MANSEVKLKHKVQLRKKIEEPKENTTSNQQQSKPKSKSWLWVLLIVVAVCVLGFFFSLWPKSDEKVEPNTPKENVETLPAPAETTENTEETATENVVEELEVADVKAEEPAVAEVKNDMVDNSGSEDVDAEAMKVIRGEYGNNPDRKAALGDRYQPIQNRVNELKAQGVF